MTMTLLQFIQSPGGYTHLKKCVNTQAYLTCSNSSDLLSACNERIANLINDNVHFNDETHIKRTLNVMAKNIAVSIKRLKRSKSESSVDNETLIKIDLSSHPNYESIDKFNYIDNSIKNHFKDDRYLNVYNHVLLGQMKYEEAAERFNIPINTVKTIVFQIRKYVKEKFINLMF